MVVQKETLIATQVFARVTHAHQDRPQSLLWRRWKQKGDYKSMSGGLLSSTSHNCSFSLLGFIMTATKSDFPIGYFYIISKMNGLVLDIRGDVETAAVSVK